MRGYPGAVYSPLCFTPTSPLGLGVADGHKAINVNILSAIINADIELRH
jgi:hypothetical protein